MMIRRYTAADQAAWNAFVRASKNAYFLFERGYMDYHADRFRDHSLMAYDDKNRLIALLPAHLSDRTLISHGGLTFGGWITGVRMTTPLMLDLFDHLRQYCAKQNISEVVYKPIPYPYHRLPADEDRFALHVNGADLIARRVMTVIDHRNRLPFQERRIRGVKKARRTNVQISEFGRSGGVLGAARSSLWTAHQTHPAHTLDEIALLRGRFPDNIRLHVACAGSELVAGVLIYVGDQVARAQYIAASERGKALGALDLLFDHLINDAYADRRYFDFGTSHHPANGALDGGLIAQKEGFGGRAVVCDTYRLDYAQERV